MPLLLKVTVNFASMVIFVFHLLFMKIRLRWISSLHSCGVITSLHSRGRDCHRPVGSVGSHWLLGADHRPPSVDLRGEEGVLGGENRPGALAFWSDRG